MISREIEVDSFNIRNEIWRQSTRRESAYFNSVTIIFAADAPVTNSMLSDKSVYDYDEDMDELFNLSTYLIEKNPLAEPQEVRFS